MFSGGSLIVFLIAVLTIGTLIVMVLIKGRARQQSVASLTHWAQEPSRFIRINGLEVHYRDEGEGPALVLLHGLFSSLHIWDKWVNRLQDRYRVIRLDLPNFSLTGPFPDHKVDDQAYMRFLEDFVTALQLERFHLAGNSLGGYFACQYASRYPQHVSKLVMLNAAGYLFVPPAALLVWGIPLLGRIADHVETPYSCCASLVRRAYADPGKIGANEIQRYHELLHRDGNRAATGRLIRHIRNRIGFDTSRVHLLTMPTLIMWGDQDHWIPVRHAQRYHQAIPGSKLIIYPDVGHMPMEEIPEQSTRDLIQFLESPQESSACRIRYWPAAAILPRNTPWPGP